MKYTICGDKGLKEDGGRRCVMEVGIGETIFGSIASRYDLANHLLSFGADFYWRKAAAGLAGCVDGGRVLDIGCGTGDMVFALAASGRKLDMVGCDVSEQMLELAELKQKRLADKGKLFNSRIGWVKGDAACTGLEHLSFDVVTCAFGLRNMMDNLGETLRHMHELLVGGGRICVLEFSLPKSFVLRPIYLFYLFWIMPLLGAIITQRIAPYRYLARTIKSWSEEIDMQVEFERAGFVDIQIKRLTLGVVTVYTAIKPGDQ